MRLTPHAGRPEAGTRTPERSDGDAGVAAGIASEAGHFLAARIDATVVQCIL